VKLTLLVRAYCHLCDEMHAALRPLAAAHGAAIDVLDVDAPLNAALEAEWGEQVPVLFAGDPDAGAVLCALRLDAERVTEALRARVARGAEIR
jgi:plasmid stability protein